MRSEPDHLIVLRIKRNGSVREIFNGPGALPWRNANSKQTNGQCFIALSKLCELLTQVPEEERLPIINP